MRYMKIIALFCLGGCLINQIHNAVLCYSVQKRIKAPIFPLSIPALAGILFVYSIQLEMTSAIIYLGLICLFTLLTLFDLYYMEIPVIPIYGMILFWLIVQYDQKYDLWWEHVFTGILVFIFFKWFCMIYKRIWHITPLGEGDIDLFFLCGLVLGQEKVLYCILIASLVGIVYSMINRTKRLPFIPFICLGCLICFIG